MLKANLEEYRKAADEVRRNDVPKDIALKVYLHLFNLRLAEEFALELDHEEQAEFASRAFQIYARALADSCDTSIAEIEESFDDALEKELKGQTRVEKINGLQEVGEARVRIAFDQPIKN